MEGDGDEGLDLEQLHLHISDTEPEDNRYLEISYNSSGGQRHNSPCLLLPAQG